MLDYYPELMLDAEKTAISKNVLRQLKKITSKIDPKAYPSQVPKRRSWARHRLVAHQKGKARRSKSVGGAEERYWSRKDMKRVHGNPESSLRKFEKSRVEKKKMEKKMRVDRLKDRIKARMEKNRRQKSLGQW